MTQRVAKSCQGASCIVLVAVEAAVDDVLDTMAQGLEEGVNGEGRDHDGHIVIQVDKSAEQILQGKDKAKVYEGQANSQAAVDQCAIDEDINVPKMGA